MASCYVSPVTNVCLGTDRNGDFAVWAERTRYRQRGCLVTSRSCAIIEDCCTVNLLCAYPDMPNRLYVSVFPLWYWRDFLIASAGDFSPQQSVDCLWWEANQPFPLDWDEELQLYEGIFAGNSLGKNLRFWLEIGLEEGYTDTPPAEAHDGKSIGGTGRGCMKLRGFFDYADPMVIDEPVTGSSRTGGTFDQDYYTDVTSPRWLEGWPLTYIEFGFSGDQYPWSAVVTSRPYGSEYPPPYTATVPDRQLPWYLQATLTKTGGTGTVDIFSGVYTIEYRQGAYYFTANGGFLIGVFLSIIGGRDPQCVLMADSTSLLGVHTMVGARNHPTSPPTIASTDPLDMTFTGISLTGFFAGIDGGSGGALTNIYSVRVEEIP